MTTIRLDDIRSLTEFQRNTRDAIKRLKKTGRPEVLTVNGHAELVVQDARSYQKLLERAREADAREELDRSIDSLRAGRVQDLDEVLDELKAKHFGKKPRAAKRR
jgi:PHD/YefM family antitoxin component YafN of YafNO toxin-antitoxin module